MTFYYIDNSVILAVSTASFPKDLCTLSSLLCWKKASNLYAETLKCVEQFEKNWYSQQTGPPGASHVGLVIKLATKLQVIKRNRDWLFSALTGITLKYSKSGGGYPCQNLPQSHRRVTHKTISGTRVIKGKMARVWESFYCRYFWC